MMVKRSQLRSPFVAGEPLLGYYNDLRNKVRYFSTEAGTGPGAERFNPVSAAQLGLGAWQLLPDHPRYRVLLESTTAKLVEEMDDRGLLAYSYAMPHTYALHAPWYSAMAQGQAASLLVRASESLDEPLYLNAAVRAASPLIDAESSLVVVTEEGPVLQEYPTDPPAHVLNGWIFALWGLYDVAWSLHAARAGHTDRLPPASSFNEAFERGVATLVRRLPLYEVRGGWSKYDLFPHPLTHVSSPFYHRLHVEQLRALAELSPHEALEGTASRWERAASNGLTVAHALARKVAFRTLRPRRRRTSR